jgi:hypothetical protein
MASFMLDRGSYYMDADELDKAMAVINKELAEESNG